MRAFKTLAIVALLLPGVALAESGPVTATYTASGSSSGDNRPCEFFQIGNSQWYAIPMTSLGSNAQIVKIESANEEYLRNNQSPAAVVSFFTGTAVTNCSSFPLADGVRRGVSQ